jgi:hypothetical protein
LYARVGQRNVGVDCLADRVLAALSLTLKPLTAVTTHFLTVDCWLVIDDWVWFYGWRARKGCGRKGRESVSECEQDEEEDEDEEYVRADEEEEAEGRWWVGV